MQCPNCGQLESKVVDSRATEDGKSIRRRRECLDCGSRFTTYERRELSPLMIKKKDGTVEPFLPHKLLRSLMTATVKRNIPLDRLEELVKEVENDLRERYRGEVPSQELGDVVLMKLRDLDKVAYVRFASVYKDFKNLDEFNEELQRLL